MCLKIRCDGESEKFCKIFWELNKACSEKISDFGTVALSFVCDKYYPIMN